MMKRFGTQVTVYRKGKSSDPYNRGKYRKASSFEGIVDETLQGGDIGMSQQKVTDDISAVMYCFSTDIKKGDVIVTKTKRYSVKKASNPMSTDSHLEVALEETEMKIDEFSV
ncbi:hypothetical protein [Bacillus thuringiensis]|uniref:hypothetical protein n=1 Tax=Bacillus thuringiensis TaxID=1428 RepID=UPI0026E34FFB|nr:hypothetical protein [Bacillus thuringiensis]MDO6634389.1 hypothetical protein [Bacillus thuringiensis]MDO6663661.1 hypothetical protein [Bacillus thuringiensis]MDO6703111.1 hypothetical protein [Bacillus thuringiensis]